jgi:hypothetical protein
LDNPLFGQQHHAFSVLGIDARSPANRSVITAKAVGVAKLIAARNAEKRHINRQLAALNQLYATAVEWICTGFSINRRRSLAQLAAQTGGVDLADHAIFNMLDQRPVGVDQRTGCQQIAKPISASFATTILTTLSPPRNAW